jgi:Domain of unknown function (DUF305)
VKNSILAVIVAFTLIGFYDLGALRSSHLKVNNKITAQAAYALLDVNVHAGLENNTVSASPEEAAFLAESAAAMKKMMMEAMDINASGNVDRDFVAMMVPHHRAAINMSQSELLYGHNEQLRRIAQGIIIEQQQEISAMQLALNHSSLSSFSSLDQSSSYADQTNTPGLHLTLADPPSQGRVLK